MDAHGFPGLGFTSKLPGTWEAGEKRAKRHAPNQLNISDWALGGVRRGRDLLSLPYLTLQGTQCTLAERA